MSMILPSDWHRLAWALVLLFAAGVAHAMRNI